jgi:hypothetical protein
MHFISLDIQFLKVEKSIFFNSWVLNNHLEIIVLLEVL